MADQPQPAVKMSKKDQKKADVAARKEVNDTFMKEISKAIDDAKTIEDIVSINIPSKIEGDDHNFTKLDADELWERAEVIYKRKDKEKLMKLISEFATYIMQQLGRKTKKVTVKEFVYDENGDIAIKKDSLEPETVEKTKEEYEVRHRREAMKIAFKVFSLYSRYSLEKDFQDSKKTPVEYILDLKQNAKDAANAKAKARRDFIKALTGGKMNKEQLEKLPEDLRTFYLENRKGLRNYKRNMRLAKIAKINDLNVNIYDYPKYLKEQKNVNPSNQLANQLAAIKQMIEKNKIKIRVPYQKIPKRMRPTIDLPYLVLREGETEATLKPEERAKRLRPVADEETLKEIAKIREKEKIPLKYNLEELEKAKIPYETAVFHEEPVGEPYLTRYRELHEAEEKRKKKVPYPYAEQYK